MDSEPEKKSKLPLLGIVTMILLFSLFPHVQNVIRQIELSDWEKTEGTVTIYEPYNYTFRYNYSVDGIEYTEWRHSFSWDTEPQTSVRPYFEEYTGPETKTQIIDTSVEYCVKTLTFTIEPGAYAEVLVLSQNDTFATSVANNFPENSAASVRIELVKAGGAREQISFFYNEPSNRTNLNLTEPGNYVITFSNTRQYWTNGQQWWCVGYHRLTVELHQSLPANVNFIEGEQVTVHYDPNNPDFGVMIMPEFSGLYSSIVALFAVYAFALYAIFNFESKPKSKPKEEEEIPPEPELEGNWWEGDTEEDQTQRCDDNPDLHYGLCEFDTYDGICWHCKNMVHPDIHLIHLICNRRQAHRLLESFQTIEGEDLDPELVEALDRILSPLEERDITSHPNLPPEDRVKALQEMDDREYILSQLEARFPDWKERNLSQFDLDPDGVGLGYMINRLYDDIHAFNQKEWGPGWAAEWKTDPPIVYPDSIYKDPPQVSRAIGLTLLAAYGWYILVEGEGMLETFAGASGAEVDLLCMLYLIPPYFIYTAFIESDVIDDEPPWDD